MAVSIENWVRRRVELYCLLCLYVCRLSGSHLFRFKACSGKVSPVRLPLRVSIRVSRHSRTPSLEETPFGSCCHVGLPRNSSRCSCCTWSWCLLFPARQPLGDDGSAPACGCCHGFRVFLFLVHVAICASMWVLDSCGKVPWVLEQHHNAC